MPLIQVALTEGRSIEEKRDLIASITRETVRVLGCKDSSVTIILTDVSRSDWATAGLSLADKAAAANNTPPTGS